MPVIYSPSQLPTGTKFRIHDFMDLGGRLADIFRFASPGSRCMGIHSEFDECLRLAREESGAVITPNILAAFGVREVLDETQAPIFLIPVPTQYHALYFNLFPYLLARGRVEKNQLVLSAALSEEVMLQLGKLWQKDSGYLRTHQLFFDPAHVNRNFYKVERIRKALSNQVSKDAFTRFVYADPFDHFEYVIGNLLNKIQYFDYLRMPAGGVAINCGVDNGWELPFFLSTMGATGHIYNIDPTGDEKLSEYSKAFCSHALCKTMMSFHKLAVWDQNKMLEFHGYGVSENGSLVGREVKSLVDAVTIDRFCEQHNLETVDIIKMDLEGAEPRALEGMSEAISRFRPQIAVCVYHTKEQNLDIPYQLVSSLRGYNFYFDTYFVDTGETVFYCIPAEKDRRPSCAVSLDPVLQAI